MSKDFEWWALVWLFCIAVGSCVPDDNEIKIIIDGKEIEMNNV